MGKSSRNGGISAWLRFKKRMVLGENLRDPLESPSYQASIGTATMRHPAHELSPERWNTLKLMDDFCEKKRWLDDFFGLDDKATV